MHCLNDILELCNVLHANSTEQLSCCIAVEMQLHFPYPNGVRTSDMRAAIKEFRYGNDKKMGLRSSVRP